MNAPVDSAAITYVGRDLEALSGMVHYYGWIVDHFAPHARGSMIEYGPGNGTVSSRLRPRVEKLDLVEPSPNLVVILRDRFGGDAAVAVRDQTLETHVVASAADSYDCAVLVNVLEHIADDTAALREIHRVLRPGGALLLFVPALPFLFSRLDAFYGHFRRYRRDDLVGLVRAAGFDVASARYLDLLGVAPWWLLNTVGGCIAFNPFMVRLYDRFGVPLTRFVENLLPTVPFGKNVILIARKKS